MTQIPVLACTPVSVVPSYPISDTHTHTTVCVSVSKTFFQFCVCNSSVPQFLHLLNGLLNSVLVLVNPKTATETNVQDLVLIFEVTSDSRCGGGSERRGKKH